MTWTRILLKGWICFTLLTFITAGPMPTQVQKQLVIAENAYAAGNFPEAIKQANEVFAEWPDAMDALFIRGMSLFKQRRLDEAQEDLAYYASRNQGLYVDEARQLLRMLDRKQEVPVEPLDGKRSFAGAAFVGFHYDSRVLIRPQEDRQVAEPEIDDTAFLLRFMANSYHPDGGFLVRYFGDWIEYNEAGQESRTANTLELGWHTRIGKRHQLELAAIGNSILLDRESYREHIAGRLRWTGYASDKAANWVAGEVGDDRYPDYSDYDGSYYQLSLGRITLLDAYRLAWDASYLDHEAQFDPVGFTDAAVGGSVSRSWRKDSETGLSLRANYTEYDAFDEVFDTQREDMYGMVSLWMRYPLLDTLTIEPSVTYIHRDSNVSRLDYDRVLIEVSTRILEW